MIADTSDYEVRAEAELKALLAALEPLEDECESELSDGILSLEFGDGTKFLINSHRAAAQIWMAANTTAWHFNWASPEAKWLDSKSAAELWNVLSEQLSKKLSRSIQLTK